MKPLELANLILNLDQSDESDITPMKLQKLMYFAHGFHLAFLGSPLIDEEFEAQKYGPIEKTVLEKYKLFGKNVIDKKQPANLDLLDSKTKTLLLDVFKVYNQYSPSKLSSITHRPGSPWNGKANYAKIKNDELQSHFGGQKDAFIKMVEDLEDEEFFENYDKKKLQDFVSFDSN